MEHEDPIGLRPGLVLLQGARLEALADMVLAWMALHPPEPLGEDAVVVPSHGVGEWFKAHAARQLGICAGVSVELPSRLAWRIWRAVLPPEDVPEPGASLFDKPVMTWWLMQHRRRAADQVRVRALQGPLPEGSASGEAEPQALGLADWRWCRDAADLFDQYQVYRPDWLRDWEAGRFVLRGSVADHPAVPIPPEQQWQAEVWQALIRQVRENGTPRGAAPSECVPRPVLQHRALMSLSSLDQRELGAAPPIGRVRRLPGRVVVLAGGPLSPPVFELLVALSRHRRVVLAVANPCQTHWVDLDDGPGGAGGHPLLAAWGRQIRDVVQQIERIDDRLAALEGRAMVRADPVPGDSPPPEDARAGSKEATSPPPALALRSSALQGLQSAIGMNEAPPLTAQRMKEESVSLADGSLRFQVAHTPLREVEVLHDHLLGILGADKPDEAMVKAPRDIVVMVPDLARYAPAIRAVFGRHEPGEPRHIPWGLADQPDETLAGWLERVDWLLGLAARRATPSEWGLLMNDPLVRRRWGLDQEAVSQLGRWLESAGMRWGLNVEHRRLLGWAQGHEDQTWRFAIDRLLAGVAWGAADPIVLAPLPEVSGLAARSVGAMASLLRRLEGWLETQQAPCTATVWCARLRSLAQDLWQAGSPEEEQVLMVFDRALSRWLRESRPAAELPLSWPVMHAAVMAILREPPAKGRFRAAGVTFCTLMPLRTVPFEVVCLLGMNDGDYPRAVVRPAADLMAQPGQARPGDRSRRDDDRQLMLDAVLSARRHLLISWTGRRPQDNQVQAPSVLVGQLRDHLAAIWGGEALDSITFEHPLQPFSRRYFEEGPVPGTFSHEWAPPAAAEHPAPLDQAPTSATAAAHRARPDPKPAPKPTLKPASDASTIEAFEQWLEHPVAALWASCTGAVWRSSPRPPAEDEVLSIDGLDRWRIHERAAQPLQTGTLDAASLLDRLGREGRLPLGAPGRLQRLTLQAELEDWAHRVVSAGWLPGAPAPSTTVQVPQDLQQSLPGLPAIWPLKGFVLQPGGDGSQARACLLRLTPRALRRSGGQPEWRDEALVLPWWNQTLLTACGHPVPLVVVASDRSLEVPPTDVEQARDALRRVWQAWRDNLQDRTPWPADATAVRAAFGTSGQQFQALERLGERDPAWRRQWGRARDWSWSPPGEGSGPNVAAWQAATERIYGDFRRWLGDLDAGGRSGSQGEEA